MTWQSQLGSLGAGNHFIELTSDADGVVRVMLHSGSRGVGNVMASRFIGIAREKALEGRSGCPIPRSLGSMRAPMTSTTTWMRSTGRRPMRRSTARS